MFNIALFGSGRIGKVHAANIEQNPETRIYSLIEPYDAYAEAFCAAYPGVKRQTVEEAMADDNVHAVCICSSTDTHADLIERAAKAGKAIFCEKPIDLDAARVRDCLAVVNQHQVPFLIGFNRRFDPHFSSLKSALERGDLGEIASVIITSRDPAPPPAQYSKSSGGMFRDMTIHDLDMARFLVGEEPIAVTAHGSCKVDPAIGEAGDIDTGVVVLTFASGAMATIHNSRRSGYGYDQRIEVHGEKGMLQVGNITENALVSSTQHGQQLATPKHFFLERYEQAFAAEWLHFVEVLKGAKPSCSGDDGERALALADAAILSMQTGATIKL
ncbi:inositol 2-dehydrogenase [Enterovibrio paralichthyis]|uniref:inositol 2-dehydrogenase n=1 Tax=Enterovibrio paralichthyis TaxID=2853805 RepID=UPI001C44D788|nr:inositol 2-dehydrogenase [Enterovibrio paralichthyis]MBV7299449.1 inositol 2-dehydrogenase [Enterovibrio paralichthyis]